MTAAPALNHFRIAGSPTCFSASLLQAQLHTPPPSNLPSKSEQSKSVVVEELRRGIEGFEVHQNYRMTHPPPPPLRAWKWDLQEMREAAVMDLTMDEALDDPHPAPSVSSFTPINQPTASFHPQHEDAAIKSESTNNSKAQKRRKTQSSAATTAPKPRKAATSKKTNRAKTAAQLDQQDISQGLSRTKPTSSRDGALPVKAGSSFGEDIPFEQNADMQRVGDRSHELKVKPAVNERKKQSKRSQAANKDQAAYVDVPDNVLNQVSPPTPPKSDEVEAEVTSKNQSYGQDSATNRQASPNDYIEPSNEDNLKNDTSIIIRDFGVPPFTQTSPPRLQDRVSQGTMTVDDSLDLIPGDLIEADDIGCGDACDDDFPMDDDFLEDIMQSMALPAEAKLVGSDCWRQGSSGATLFSDEQLEKDRSRWPRAVSDPDGVAIYDEDPTLVASDIIDDPSSTQRSSQASCILSHVADNANSDHTRTSKASETCFDDNELDDGLIDLTVDEITAPVTPAKRSLSPKLQWLSPKTFTPAKSSRTPVSPNDDPRNHVPVDAYGRPVPFARPPFPKAVQDRSPILGLTNRMVLRICFRIGEALNAAAVASRENVDAIIELYARVVFSSREAGGGYKQNFQFGDLFTDKPPYLSGTYTLWKGVEVWDNDSKRFVGEQGRGKMARVLGRIKKTEPGQGQGPGVEMVILSVWEVDWEDIGVAKGIACPE